MLKLLQNLFSKDKPESVTTEPSEPVKIENRKPTIKPSAPYASSVLTKPCKTCGKPITFEPPHLIQRI